MWTVALLCVRRSWRRPLSDRWDRRAWGHGPESLEQRAARIILTCVSGEGNRWKLLHGVPGIAHWRIRSKPSSSGIARSLTSTWGGALSNIRSASVTVAAAVAVAPASLRTLTSSRRASTSSSTTRTRTPQSCTWVSGNEASLSASLSCAPSASPIARMGNSTANIAPRPSPSLWACTIPPCASTSALTMERPSPSPPNLRLLPDSLAESVEDVWKKIGSNPLAGVADLDADPGALAGQRDPDLPSLGCKLDRVDEQVPDDLPNSRRVAEGEAGGRVKVGVDAEGFLLCHRQHDLDGFGDHRRQLAGAHRQIELA